MPNPMGDLSSLSRETPALVFVNPCAGGGRARTYLPRIKNLFAAQQFHADFVFTSSMKELESRTRTAISAGRRVLLAMGGDGTFQGLVNAAYSSDALLGILPTGGGNDFGRPSPQRGSTPRAHRGWSRAALRRWRRTWPGCGSRALCHRIPSRARPFALRRRSFARPQRILAAHCPCRISRRRIPAHGSERFARGRVEHPDLRRWSAACSLGADR